MTLGIFNARSAIARALIEMLAPGEPYIANPAEPFSCDRFLICEGYLAGKAINDMTRAEAAETFHRNCTDVMAMCELILENNSSGRICIIGSESGFAGSYDQAYAAAKAGIHQYVENRRLSHPGQQLVAIAPTVIWDSGMTQRRHDVHALEVRGQKRRRGRWLAAREVAALAHFVLYQDEGSLSNIVIRQNGGNW